MKQNHTEEVSKRTNRKRTAITAAVCCAVIVLVSVLVVLAAIAGNSNVTVKGNYTVDDSKACAKADAVVAKVGDMELTNGVLQVFYWETVRTYMDSYGSYLNLFYDLSKPLSEITYDQETGLTMEQYFLELVVNNWSAYARLCQDAGKSGVEVSRELADELEGLSDSLDPGGHGTVEALIQHQYGAAAEFADFEAYMYLYRFANEYYHGLYANAQWTEDELEQYYLGHESVLQSNGYGKTEGMTADVRHIMLYVDEDSQEAWDACHDKAESILNTWLEGEATSESFGELANLHSEDEDTNTTGGLYSNVTVRSGYPDEFLRWSLSPDRKAGDYEIVATDYSLHIMYCVSAEALWHKGSRENLTAQWLSDKVDALAEEYPLEIDYSKVVLAQVDLDN